MKINKSKIVKLLFGEMINIKIKIPSILLIYIVGIPLFAYVDAVWIGRKTFLGYLFVCSIETFLVMLGYFLRVNGEKAIKRNHTQ